MRQNNKGFTLIELLIVIAIVAIAAAALIPSMATVQQNDVRKATLDFSALLEQGQIATLSGKLDPRVVLSYDGTKKTYLGAIWVRDPETNGTTVLEELELGGIDLQIYIADQPDVDTVQKLGKDIYSYIITFDRETGAFLQEDLKEIQFGTLNEVGTDYTIHITPATGYMEILTS